MRITQQKASDFKILLDKVRQSPEAKKELGKLDKATRDVEAVFVKMLVGQMRKTGMKPLLGNGMEAQMYTDFLDDAIAKQVASGGGLGIGKMLYIKMSDALLKRIAAQREQTDSADTAVPSKIGAAAKGLTAPIHRRTANEN